MSLTVTNLRARHGRIEVCHDLSFAVETGEFLTVLGLNGAGKSSLLGAVAGWVAADGAISVDGRRIDGLPARRRARSGVAFVPEGRRNLFPPLTVDDNLRLGLRLLPERERPEMRARIHDLFPILRAREREVSGMLSGGEQQMLALAVAIARRPAVLLLDEPSQGLAPVVLDEIAAAIGRLRALGLTLVLAEQNHAFASRLADRFIALQGGEIVDAGDRVALASRERAAASMVGL